MGVVGDIVGDRGKLRFGAGEAPQLQILQPHIIQDRLRNALRAIGTERRTVAIGERTVVLDQAFERFPGEVETVEVGVTPLQRGHDA